MITAGPKLIRVDNGSNGFVPAAYQYAVVKKIQLIEVPQTMEIRRGGTFGTSGSGAIIATNFPADAILTTKSNTTLDYSPPQPMDNLEILQNNATGGAGEILIELA